MWSELVVFRVLRIFLSFASDFRRMIWLILNFIYHMPESAAMARPETGVKRTFSPDESRPTREFIIIFRDCTAVHDHRTPVQE